MRLRALLVAAGIATLAVAPAAHADSFTVTTTTDGTGTCDKASSCTTIRAAMTAASATTSDDTIIVPPGTTTLTGGDLTPPSNVTFQGSSARTTVIQGNGKARIFTIGGERIVNFSNLTMANGTAGGGQGGNLLVGSSARVILDHVRVTGGQANQGAGIAATSPLWLIIGASLIDNNTASGTDGDGGGIYFAGSASASRIFQLTDSTVAFNTGVNGGGLAFSSNATTTGTLTRDTIARNTSSQARGGGIHLDSTGPITATGTIVANNTGNIGIGRIPQAGPANCTIAFGDNGSNVESQSDCGFALPSDRQKVDPGLSAGLLNAGGQTDLLTLPATSVAVDLAGSCSSAADQRDMPRPQGAACDAGAYEYVALDTTITTGPSGASSSRSATFTQTTTDPRASFECRLDGPGAAVGTFQGCKSTQAYSNLADGAYTYRVQAVHGDLVDDTPATRSFSVDTAAPAAPAIVSPAEGAWVASTSVTLTGTAEADATVTIREGTTTLGTAVANASGAWSRVLTGVANGTHLYTATAQDAVGNTGPASPARTVRVDTVAPAAPAITAPPDNQLQNVSTVTLSGTAEPNATVEILEGPTSRGTATATASGTWTRAIPSVGDGTHTYVATARDAAGNLSGTSNQRSVRVDTTAPAAPAITTPSGNVSQKSSTVTVSGTAEAGASVEVLDGTTSRGSVTATATGTWTTTLTSVADGAHVYTARARDVATNLGPASASRTVTVDTVPPPAPVITTPAGNVLQRTATVTLSGNAEANAAVEVREGTASRGTVSASVAGAWSLTLNNVADGAHTYTARATDQVGNLGPDSAARTITVDTAAPETTITGGPTAPSKDVNPSFSFTSSESGTFECRLDGPSGTGTPALCTSPKAYSNLVQGAYTLTVTAIDAAGNRDQTPATRQFSIDTAVPAQATITMPAADVLQRTATVTLTGAAEASARVEVLDGSTSRGTVDASAGGVWTLTLNNVADGAHRYTARATDAAGNTGAASAVRTVTVDTAAPPAPAITAPATDVTQGFTTVNLAGTAEANASVEVREGTASRGTVTASGGGAWSLAIQNVTDGPHTYTARATDPAGNVGPDSPTRTITVDTTAPDTQITDGPDALTNVATPSFSFTASASGSKFTCKLNGPGATTGTPVACGSPKAYGPLAAGLYTFSVFATDAAGNPDTTPATRTFTVDTAAPVATIDSGPSGPVKVDPQFTFHSEAGASFECRMKRGATVLSDGACSSPESYGDLSETEGDYEFAVRATDEAGNTGAFAIRDFSVDTTAPPADVVTGPDGPITDTAASFGFSAPGAATTECRLDGPGAVVGSFGSCSSPAVFSSLAPGEYLFSMRATDAAGNETTTTRSFSVAAVQAQPQPTPTPTPPPAPPAPEPGKTVVIQPVSGQTLVQVPGSSKFVPVDVTRGIPVGSTVDTRKSKIRLYAIPKAGKPAESALFYDGIFKVTQSGGITELRLVEQLAACPKPKAKKAGAAAAKKKKPKTRKLWGEGSGSFRTRGQYSSATVRGTKWLVQDSCGKTLTRVAKGVVSVQDFVKKTTHLVRAPKSYTAKKKK